MVTPRSHPQPKPSTSHPKALHSPITFYGHTQALPDKASPPGSHREQQGPLLTRPPPRGSPRAAQLHTSGTSPGWSPEGRAGTSKTVRPKTSEQPRASPPCGGPSAPAWAPRSTEPKVRVDPWAPGMGSVGQTPARPCTERRRAQGAPGAHTPANP